MKAKRILASILSLAMVLGSISLMVFADDAVNVAKIGDTSYKTLTEAFAAAKKGDTIELLADVKITEQINVTDNEVLSDLTIDGQNHTISAGELNQSNTSVFYFGNPSGVWCTGVEIKDLTIDVKTARFGIFLCGGTSSVLTNVTVKGDYVYGINLYGTHGAIMTNCDIVSMFTNAQDDNPLILDNTRIGTLTANESEDSADKGKITINDNSTVDTLYVYGGNTRVVGSGIENVTTVVDAETDTAMAVCVNGVQYASLDASLDAALEDGEKEIEITVIDDVAFSTKVANFDKVTFTGTNREQTIDLNINAAFNQNVELVFNNLTVSRLDSNWLYHYFYVKGGLSYNNCKMVGLFNVTAQDTDFIGCDFYNDDTFGDGNYSIWLYNCSEGVEVNITDCTFDVYERAIKMYGDGYTGSMTLNISNTTFTSRTADKTVVEMAYDNSTGTGSMDLNITESTASGFGAPEHIDGDANAWFNVEGTDTVSTVIIDNEVVYRESLMLPTAEVTDIPETELEEKDAPDLTFALKFTAVEPTEKQLEYYGDWYADFELTVNKKATFNATNEEADGYLAGQYSAWSESWVSVPFEDVTLEAGDSLKIMECAASLMGQPGLKITYNDVVTAVKIFNCGIYFTDEFIAENPHLEVTLSLNMYNPEDETEKYTIGDTYIFNPVTCEWTTDTDAGYYMNGTDKLGLMRWLFMATLNGSIDTIGIEYQGTNTTTSVEEEVNTTITGDGTIVFYGDVNGFIKNEATKDSYSARGFVKSGSITNYSDIVLNAPDWERELDYEGGTN